MGIPCSRQRWVGRDDGDQEYEWIKDKLPPSSSFEKETGLPKQKFSFPF